jgi:ATP-binding cassette subfamily B protein
MSRTHAPSRTEESIREPGTWRLGWRLARYLPRRYLAGGSAWAALRVLPLLSGLALKGLFDGLSHRQGAGEAAGFWFVAAFLAVEVLRQGVLAAALILWPYWLTGVETLLRGNTLGSILCAPGSAATRLPRSSGEAMSRFRDDVRDLVRFTDMWVDLTGDVIFGAVALAIMVAIDPVVTGVIVLPSVAVVLVTVRLSEAIRRNHRAARQAGAQVTAFIGELFANVLALKTAGAEDAALSRLRQCNSTRRDAEIRSHLLVQTVDSLSASSVSLSVGLVLLLAAPAIGGDDFTIGDLALFTAYAGWLTSLPRRLGRLLYRQRQASVAATRLGRLLTPEEGLGGLVAHRPLWFDRPAPPVPVRPRRAADRLEVLEVDGLTARHPISGRGIESVDLRLVRGSFTVVTGAVGSGKTTLLRAVLGLLPHEGGTIRWNGAAVDDPGSVLVPPRAAYTGQVPVLFSASLAENLLLGLPDDVADAALARALRLAVLDDDVAGMPDGLDTVIGPRGIRLSGGQAQRTAAARALVRNPELLVVDDLSSALDVETEAALWRRLADDGPATCLVVSHRRPALLRADQVLVLSHGRVAGCGPLHDLLRTCPEMRRLWAQESTREVEEELTS